MASPANTTLDHLTDLVEDSPTLPALLSDDFVARFEKGIEIYKRFISACYQLTRESHWLNQGTADKPHYSLQAPGAEALMNPLNITFEEPRYRREDKQDDTGSFYLYWCEGAMESRTLNRRGYYIGCCDSRDQFFNARRGWNPATGEGDIKKSAFSNWTVNGVTRLAGLRDPDPELLKAAGLDLHKIQAVDYSGRKAPEDEGTVISDAQRKRLWALCKNFGVGEERLKAYLLPLGYTSTAVIRKRDYEAICRWVENRGKAQEPREPGSDG